MKMWRRWCAASIATLGMVVALTQPAYGEIRFLRGADETTVTQSVFPWTTADACSCCSDWETALATAYSYWDDFAHGKNGPWEKLLLGGNGFSAHQLATLSDTLHQASKLECHQSVELTKGDALVQLAQQVTLALGYQFEYQRKDPVNFKTIKDEIDADRPVLFAARDTAGERASLVVGYDDKDLTLFVYDTTRSVVTRRGFDEASSNAALLITPGGRSQAPSNWTCPVGKWEGRDGCQCGCGAYDPDCDDPTQAVENCDPGQFCGLSGACEAACTDDCSAGHMRCGGSSTYQICADHDQDRCLEWGPAKDCGPKMKCENDQCMPDCKAECTQGERECTDGSTYRVCSKQALGGCPLWSNPVACAQGVECRDGGCVGAEDCANGYDDDDNGKTDCEDLKCNGDPACVSIVKEICNNSKDDDGDDAIDCQDPDCLGSVDCRDLDDDGGCAVQRVSNSDLGHFFWSLLLVGLIFWRRSRR